MKKILMLMAAGMFATGTAMAGERMGYQELDADGDGTISAEEAKSSPELMDSWTAIDTNADGVLDEAEFSAFETMQPAQQ